MHPLRICASNRASNPIFENVAASYSISYFAPAPSRLPWGLDKVDQLQRLLQKHYNSNNNNNNSSNGTNVLNKATTGGKELAIAELPDDIAVCLEKDLSLKCTAAKKQLGHGLFLWEILGKC